MTTFDMLVLFPLVAVLWTLTVAICVGIVRAAIRQSRYSSPIVMDPHMAKDLADHMAELRKLTARLRYDNNPPEPHKTSARGFITGID